MRFLLDASVSGTIDTLTMAATRSITPLRPAALTCCVCKRVAERADTLRELLCNEGMCLACRIERETTTEDLSGPPSRATH